MRNIQIYFVLDSLLVLQSSTDHILLLAFQQFFFDFVDFLLPSAVFLQLPPTLLLHCLSFELKNLLNFVQVLEFDCDGELVAVLVGSEDCFDD